MLIFDKPLKVGKTDIYTVTVADEWLDNQQLNNATAVVDNAGVATVQPATLEGGNKVVSMSVTGVTEGFVTIDVNFSTVNRSDCVKVGLNVVDC